jgi:hypothetical protein
MAPIILKVKGWEKICHANINKNKTKQNKPRIALMSDKIELEEWRVWDILSVHKRINSLERYNHSKCVCFKQESLKVYEVKTAYRQLYLGDLITPLSATDKTTREEIGKNRKVNQPKWSDKHR